MDLEDKLGKVQKREEIEIKFKPQRRDDIMYKNIHQKIMSLDNRMAQGILTSNKLNQKSVNFFKKLGFLLAKEFLPIEMREV
jgi:hypothetical protein